MIRKGKGCARQEGQGGTRSSRPVCICFSTTTQPNPTDLNTHPSPHPTPHDPSNIEVTLLEAGTQLMPPLDPEMTQPVNALLASKGVNLQLNDGVAGFEQVLDRLWRVVELVGMRECRGAPKQPESGVPTLEPPNRCHRSS